MEDQARELLSIKRSGSRRLTGQLRGIADEVPVLARHLRRGRK
jgi:hypothetical protein